MSNRTKFGLLGKNISYSFSKKYFTEKFKQLGLSNYSFVNIDIPEIEELPYVLYQRKDDFLGLSVTIPYKESVMNYLDEINEDAKKIGAVNAIKFTEDNKMIGYNTDFLGFKESLKPFLKSHHKKALILGTGGASKAVAYALQQLSIEYKFVSRKVAEGKLLYSMLNEEIMSNHLLIINCTPLGTSPNVEVSPNIPYQYLTEKHLLFDLIYNPEETKFLLEGKKRGAVIKNGLEMLELQAELSWKIWNS